MYTSIHSKAQPAFSPLFKCALFVCVSSGTYHACAAPLIGARILRVKLFVNAIPSTAPAPAPSPPQFCDQSAQHFHGSGPQRATFPVEHPDYPHDSALVIQAGVRLPFRRIPDRRPQAKALPYYRLHGVFPVLSWACTQAWGVLRVCTLSLSCEFSLVWFCSCFSFFYSSLV